MAENRQYDNEFKVQAVKLAKEISLACAPAKGEKNSQVSNFNQKPGYVKRAAHRRPHR